MSDELITHRGNAKDLHEFIPAFPEGQEGYHSTWRTPEAFYEHVSKLDRSKAWSDAGWEHDKNWSGTSNMDEALSLAKNGWKEGMEQVERTRTRTMAQNPVRPQAVRYGIAGTVPNVPRAIAGNIFNMKEHAPHKSTRRPVITLVSNMAANCGVPAVQISNRAAVVAAIVDQIESAGYATEVLATSTTKGYGKGFSSAVTVCVKKSDQYADVNRLAFALGHVSMFRRLTFADWGTDASNRSGLGSGLGSNNEIKPTEDMNFRNIYSLPSPERMGELFKDEETASTKGYDYLINSLRKQKCPALPPLREDELAAFKAKAAEMIKKYPWKTGDDVEF